MKETEWGWWVGHSDEMYCIGPLADRDDAIQEAINDGGFVDTPDDGGFAHQFHIIEATKPVLEIQDYFIAEHWLEKLNENLADYGNENCDPVVEVDAEQIAALELAVKTAIVSWAKAHKPTVRSYMFKQTRNAEHVEIRCKEDGEVLDGKA